MHHSRKIFLSLCLSFIFLNGICQVLKLSFGGDIGVARNFKQQQQYWTAEQNLAVHLHFTPENGAYVWFTLHGNGKFTNDLTAMAKSPVTIPQQIAYNNRTQLSFKHFSLGWKRYIKGAANAEARLNIYGLAGFGLLMGHVSNDHSVTLDTTVYTVPVRAGEASFKRLTLDMGAGAEVPLGGNFYVYLEGKTLIPITDYPTPYMLPAKYAPLTASLHMGLRILFLN